MDVSDIESKMRMLGFSIPNIEHKDAVNENVKTLLEYIDNVKILDKVLDEYNKISNLDVGFFLKEGSPVFALAFYKLTNEKGIIFKLVDSEKAELHYIIKYNNKYWDINGYSSDIKDKVEYSSPVGLYRWENVSPKELVLTVKDRKMMLNVYAELKDLYLKIKIGD